MTSSESRRFPGQADRGQSSYFEAFELAKSQLGPTHPVRLGLALNYSVFFYETTASPDRACQLAKQVQPTNAPAIGLIPSRASRPFRKPLGWPGE